MKIKRLKLVNFIGIFHGIEKKELEINFTDSKFVMLLGKNGSGKTTILSQLHPYKDSFDERKQLILDGHDGRKEIDFEDDEGNSYEIVHIYANTPQSFFKKNGEELNENGGIRTCEDLITKHLGITKEYFKIGKISSNTKNFVELQTSERKNYIGNFLDIEELTNAYSNARNKFTALKKEISSVGDELKAYEEKEILEEKIKILEESIKHTEEKLSEELVKKGSYDILLKGKREEIKNLNVTDNSLELSRKKNSLNSAILENRRLEERITLEDISHLEEEITKLDSQISNRKISLEISRNDLKNSSSKISELNNSISKLKMELKSFEKTDDLEDFKIQYKENVERIKILKSEISSGKYGREVAAFKKKFGISPLVNLERVKELLNYCEKYFSELSEIIKFLLNSEFNSKINSEQRELKNNKEKLNNEVLSLEKKIEKKNVILEQVKSLSKRPEECHINDCYFIKTAYENRNVESEIKKLEEELSLSKKKLENTEIEISNKEEIKRIGMNFLSLYSEMSGEKNKAVYEIFLSGSKLEDLFLSSIIEFSKLKDSFIEEFTEKYEKISEFEKLFENTKILEKNIKLLEEKDISYKEKIELDLRDLEDKLIEEENVEGRIKENIEKESNELAFTENYKQLLLSYKDNIQEIVDLESSIIKLNLLNEEYEKLKNEEIEIMTSQQKVANSINYFENEKRKFLEEINEKRIKFSHVGILEEKLKRLKDDFVPTQLVMNALSPTSGIPLILIKLYLEKTQEIANELLKLAFNGDFQIEFESSSKDFLIKVRTKDNIKNDIKLASQGEISLATLSISLALIEQSISKYNILCLDEIDGPLDEGNREIFLEIIQKQIEKIGIEQVFIISHNNAFDSCSLDLITLREDLTGKENFLKNKNIIFKAE